MLDRIIEAFEKAEEHSRDCGYISISLELKDLIIKELKEIKAEGKDKRAVPPPLNKALWLFSKTVGYLRITNMLFMRGCSPKKGV